MRQLALSLALISLTVACAVPPRDRPPRERRPGIDVPGLLLAPDAPSPLICGHRGDFYGDLLTAGTNTLSSF